MLLPKQSDAMLFTSMLYSQCQQKFVANAFIQKISKTECERHKESVNESVSTLFLKVLHVDDLASQSIAVHSVCVSVWI